MELHLLWDFSAEAETGARAAVPVRRKEVKYEQH